MREGVHSYDNISAARKVTLRQKLPEVFLEAIQVANKTISKGRNQSQTLEVEGKSSRSQTKDYNTITKITRDIIQSKINDLALRLNQKSSTVLTKDDLNSNTSVCKGVGLSSVLIKSGAFVRTVSRAVPSINGGHIRTNQMSGFSRLLEGFRTTPKKRNGRTQSLMMSSHYQT